MPITAMCSDNLCLQLQCAMLILPIFNNYIMPAINNYLWSIKAVLEKLFIIIRH